MPYDHRRIQDLIQSIKHASTSFGAHSYIVGGAVRDILTLNPPKDIDVTTDGDVEQISKTLAGMIGGRADKVVAPFGLWNVSVGDISVDMVKLESDIQSDVKKRNFTINAIYYDITNDEFVDPSGMGVSDLRNKIIRSITTLGPNDRSDNIFIALRLVSEVGYKVDPRTLHMMSNYVKSLGANVEVTKRGRKEISRAQQGLFFKKAVFLAKYLGLSGFFSAPTTASTIDLNTLKVLIAKYKSKKKTEKGNVIYEYGEKDKARRAEKKARHVRTVLKNIKKLVKKFEGDLSSDDMHTKMSALAVALIYHTYERVGDRGNIGTGITSLKKKHISVSGNTVKLKYVGKSHVKQNKEVSDAKIAKIVKELLKDKSSNGYLFDYEGDERVDITAKDVNEYLEPFSITAKDLRGHAANDLLIDKLKKQKKPPSGSSDAERKKFFKDNLKKCIEEVAEEIGHTPGICKSSYIDPKLIESYEESGKVTKLAMSTTVKFLSAEDEVASYVVKNNPSIPSEEVQGAVESLRSKIDSSDVELDPDVASVAEVVQAIDKLKSVNPEALRGVLRIQHKDKFNSGGTPAPSDAYAFVVSNEPFIVYIDADKIKRDVQAGKDVSSDLLTPEVVAQIAGVIGHEHVHSEGDTGEENPTRYQEEIVNKLLGSSTGTIVTAAEDDNVFSTLGIPVSRESAIESSERVIDKLKLGQGDRAKINAALLSLGYLISIKENPYRAAWHIKKHFNIDGDLSFDAATQLYDLLNRNVGGESLPSPSQNNLSLFSDPTGEPADLGSSVSPKWEANPSTWPEEWHGFFPQRHPVNY